MLIVWLADACIYLRSTGNFYDVAVIIINSMPHLIFMRLISSPKLFEMTSFSQGILGQNRRDAKRTLGIRDQQIVYKRDKKRCQACGKKVDFHEKHIGHVRAWSKGGATTVRNSVVLCYGCNHLQGTDSLSTLKRKLKPQANTKKKKAPIRKKRKRTKETQFFGGLGSYGLMKPPQIRNPKFW